jgi:hypothetical protein
MLQEVFALLKNKKKSRKNPSVKAVCVLKNRSEFEVIRYIIYLIGFLLLVRGTR